MKGTNQAGQHFANKPSHVAADITKDAKTNTKIWIITSIVAVGLCVLISFLYGAFTSDHTYGPISFESNGLWTVMHKNTDNSLGLDQTTIEVQSGKLKAEVQSLTLPGDTILSYSKGFGDRIANDTLATAHDVINKDDRGIKYVGGWYVAGGGDLIEAHYSILDLNKNTLVTFTLTGPKSQQDKIVDIYKTVKYDDVLISSIQ